MSTTNPGQSSPVDEVVERLENFLNAYPEDVFPTPPPELQAKNAAAADVLRRVAFPVVREALDALRHAD